MSLEITPAAIALIGLLAALLLHDVTTIKNRRLLALQIIVFTAGAVLIVCPEIARRLARAVGIGRGVDFVLYPLVIWLVRESLLTRRRRHEDEAKMTEIVRAMAIDKAHFVSGNGVSRSSAPLQSDASASS
ncbi:MAG: DUF2304 domain-containing protein [Polyangiaceae bacterium]|nr:DUF2304 domain-containing protein [Polyangiaceae bacterium]